MLNKNIPDVCGGEILASGVAAMQEQSEWLCEGHQP
jgi:hypothetical protein